jgi:kynurenine formamidase
MRRGFVVCAIAMVTMFTLHAQSVPAPRTLAEFDALFMQISNWGRWGKNDQLGAASLVDDAKRKQAASLVKLGLAMSIAHNVITEEAPDNQGPFTHKINPMRGPVLTDSYQIGGHSGTATHMDAMCHILYKGSSYNGYSQSEVINEQGCTKLDINAMKNGVMTRGVLFDIPRLKGVAYLEAGSPIYTEDLEAWERRTGVKVTSGDAVLVRTGRWTRRAEKGPWDLLKLNAGLHPSTATWFKLHDVAFLGTDVPDGVQPLAFEGVPFPVHTLLITGLGMTFLDEVDLEELAATAARLKRWDFMLTVAPMPFPGGTGAPINPIAVF